MKPWHLPRATDPVRNAGESGSTLFETLGIAPPIHVQGTLVSRMKSIRNCIARELTAERERLVTRRPWTRCPMVVSFRLRVPAIWCGATRYCYGRQRATWRCATDQIT